MDVWLGSLLSDGSVGWFVSPATVVEVEHGLVSCGWAWLSTMGAGLAEVVALAIVVSIWSYGVGWTFVAAALSGSVGL